MSQADRTREISMRLSLSSIHCPLQIDVVRMAWPGTRTRCVLQTADSEMVEILLDSGQVVLPPPVECDVIMTCVEGEVSIYLLSAIAQATRQDLSTGDMALIEANVAYRIQSNTGSVLLVSKPLRCAVNGRRLQWMAATE
jgi:hypothetical protein